MFGIFNDLWKEFEKELQLVSVRSVGRTLIRQKNRKQKEIQKSSKYESGVAKQSISSASTDLQETVKGKFGKKITEILNEQNETLEEFLDT